MYFSEPEQLHTDTKGFSSVYYDPVQMRHSFGADAAAKGTSFIIIYSFDI